MSNEVSRTGGLKAGLGGAVVSALALSAFIAAVPGFAQDKAPAAAPAAKPAAAAPAAKPAAAAPAAKPAAAATPAAGAAPAPAAAAAPAPAAGAVAGTAGDVAAAAGSDANKSAWVKLCEKAPIVKKDKDGKDVKEEKELCLTHHERLDGNTGMVLVSAAIRKVEGQDKQSLMVMVPLGMAIPPGIRAAIYTKEQWAAAAKNEKVDDKALKPIELKYSLCHPAGCTAETEATKEIIDQMKAGGGIMVLAMNAGAQPIGFPVPLDGFTEAESGAPIDNKKYAEARGALMKSIRENQKKMAEQARTDQSKAQEMLAEDMKDAKAGNGKAPPGTPIPDTTGSTAAPAAKAPAAAAAAPKK